jgi:hypothetical protein
VKRTLMALAAGALVGSVITGIALMSSASAANTAAQAASQTPTGTVAAIATPNAVVVATPAATVVAVKEPKGWYSGITDPVLVGGKWGTRSSRVHGALGQKVTSDIHDTVEATENVLLLNQQSHELLEIFEDARGVTRLITRYGGDPDDTRYFVKEIQANEDDVGNGVAWVTATLRADFPSPEGMRGIEMVVYRRKISQMRLDNTPYVASTQIGYVHENGDLSTKAGYNPPGDTGVFMDGLHDIRFKN